MDRSHDAHSAVWCRDEVYPQTLAIIGLTPLPQPMAAQLWEMEAMPATRSVLIVEDDEVLRDMLKEQLADDHGFIVFTAPTLEAADKVIDDKYACVDAVILDRGMPDGDGCDYCAKLRRHGHNMPVIMLTGMDGEEDVVRGLESGAHDYIAKPFRINELLARLRAQLRGFDSSEDATFSIGPYIFQPSKKLLQNSATDRCILLTEKEVAVLKYLYHSNDHTVDRERLLHDVWGYNDDSTSHTIEVSYLSSA